MSCDSFCSRLSFQGCLYSKQPWKIGRGKICLLTRMMKMSHLDRFARSSFIMSRVPHLWHRHSVCTVSTWVHSTLPDGTSGPRKTDANMKLMLPAVLWVIKPSVCVTPCSWTARTFCKQEGWWNGRYGIPPGLPCRNRELILSALSWQPPLWIALAIESCLTPSWGGLHGITDWHGV